LFSFTYSDFVLEDDLYEDEATDDDFDDELDTEDHH